MTPLMRWALGIVVLLTAVAAFLSGKAAQDVRESSACQKQIQTQLVRALNQRTLYTDSSAKAQQQVRQSLAELVDASLTRPPPPVAEQRRIVKDLQTSLNEAERLTAKTSDKRDRYPYPTYQQIKACP